MTTSPKSRIPGTASPNSSHRNPLPKYQGKALSGTTRDDRDRQKLWSHVMEHGFSGCEFNSKTRHDGPLPRCRPGTRATFLRRIQDWSRDQSRERRILWLHGPAGVGKSAILQTTAEETRPERGLVTLFLSGPNPRQNAINDDNDEPIWRPFNNRVDLAEIQSEYRGNLSKLPSPLRLPSYGAPTIFRDPTKVIPTIACQLARTHASYRAYLMETFVRNPQNNIAEQFNEFIVEPIANRGLLNGVADSLIILDALDELENEEAQNIIIYLITKFVIDFPLVPLIWLISSRPEEHITTAFSSPDIESILLSLPVPIDDDVSREDVRRYLEDGFEEIRKQYQLDESKSSKVKSRYSSGHWRDTLLDLNDGSQWPPEDGFNKIADAVSGWFMCAELFLRFIRDPKVKNPRSQLGTIVSQVDNPKLAGVRTNPFNALDMLYQGILSKVPKPAIPIVQHLLGHLLLCEGFFSRSLPLFGYSLASVSNIFGYKREDVRSALQKLPSVLYIPPPEIDHKENIRFLHTTFSSFLLHQIRSNGYTINLNEVHAHIWKCYSRVIQQAGNNLDPKLRMAPQLAIDLSWPLVGSKHEKRIFAAGLLHEAQFHWAHFLIPHCPCGVAFTNPALPVRDSIPDRERLEMLQSVNFKQLVTGYFVDGSDHFGPFFRFLVNLWIHFRVLIKEYEFIRETQLECFSMDFIDTKMLNAKDQAICVEETLQCQEDGTKPSPCWRTREMSMTALVEEVGSLQVSRPQTTVLVCGTKASQMGALVAHHQGSHPLVYYYLPLDHYSLPSLYLPPSPSQQLSFFQLSPLGHLPSSSRPIPPPQLSLSLFEPHALLTSYSLPAEDDDEMVPFIIYLS